MSLRLQSLGEFWQALGGKPKAALHYTVTIGVEPFSPQEVTPVTEILIQQGLKED
ncbi:MAG: Pvc16 family protein [Xenococcaceae cyanobacterium MO_167.B27]|nr:Pvc16 family protein [Xenococcaceae cyanobacterium MO_167.B27]